MVASNACRDTPPRCHLLDLSSILSHPLWVLLRKKMRSRGTCRCFSYLPLFQRDLSLFLKQVGTSKSYSQKFEKVSCPLEASSTLRNLVKGTLARLIVCVRQSAGTNVRFRHECALFREILPSSAQSCEYRIRQFSIAAGLPEKRKPGAESEIFKRRRWWHL